MANPKELTTTANTLHNLYKQLDDLKHATPPRGERIMKPRPGPQTPAPITLISLDYELTSRLFKLVTQACTIVYPNAILNHQGLYLTTLVTHIADRIAPYNISDQLNDEMLRQIKLLDQKLNLEPPTQPNPEPYQPAAAIIQLTAQHGHTITRQQLRQWAHRGHITTQQQHGHATYKLSDITQHIHNNRHNL